MPSQHTKPVAVITGCSEPKSLGAAFARELLGQGWTVFATARKMSTLEGLKGEGCEVLALDVSSDESVQQAAKAVIAHTSGRVNLLINNAGFVGRAPLTHTDPAKLAAMHDIHVLGPLRLAQAFFPSISQSATPISRGKIVNIGSVVSHGLPWHAAYATTKAGVQVLSDVMRREFKPFNIDVITLELALVRTAMSDGAKDFPLGFDDTVEPFGNASAAISKSAEDFEKDSSKAPRPIDIAKAVIDAVEKTHSPGKLWLGKDSFFFHHIIPYLPTWVTDKIFAGLMNLDLVRS